MYVPKEDSFFLSQEIKKYLKKLENKDIRVLDMGTGSGIQADACSKYIVKDNILCVDIDKEALDSVGKRGFKVMSSNLFQNIRGGFDLVLFNPPYLPQNRYDKEKDTTGGKLGDETILRFLKQAKKHLNKNGKILLLVSSLTPQKRIREELKKLKLGKIKLVGKKLFFEKLEIWCIS